MAAQLDIFGGETELEPAPIVTEREPGPNVDQGALFGICQDGETIVNQGELI